MVLKIACLLKQVPLPSEMRIGSDGLMDRTTARSRINNDCSFALEQALELEDQVGGFTFGVAGEPRPAEVAVLVR